VQIRPTNDIETPPPRCLHESIRAVTGGHCILCDGPLPIELIHDADAELLEAELEAQAELTSLDADAAFLSLAEFVRQGWHVLEPLNIEWNWHHDALCANVQGMLEEWMAFRDGERLRMRWQNLVLNICPSTLKSRIVMVFAVAWMWLRCPQWSVLCVSANPANVTRDAESCRDLVTSKWYRETFRVEWKIRDDIDSKSKFATTAGGTRYSRGMLAKVTGIHVDCILLDDPDDANDVHSEAARRERAGKWEAMGNRVNDLKACIRIILQQRVHVDDCTGDVLSRGGWLHASYALEFRDEWRRDTPFYSDPRTLEGENMHPARFTPEVIAGERLRLGSQGFEAQYNQNPSPREGGMLKRLWFRWCRIANRTPGPAKRPQGCSGDEARVIDVDTRGRMIVDWVTITVDATFGSLSDTASAVGLLVVAGIGHDRLVLDDKTKPMTFTQTKTAIRELLTAWPECTRVIVERKANGQAIIDDMEREFPGFIGVDPYGGKESRAAAMSPAIESGSVYLLEGAVWVDEFITELTVFPHGKRDDRVDSLSQLMAYFRESLDSQKLAAKNAAMNKLRSSTMMQAMLRR
jgi:predicted phage terminase large subunit-like protein